MSKARGYFNDLPTISMAPSRTASSSSAQQRAPFKPPRPSGEAPSKGTMASTSGVQKRAPAKKADKGKASATVAGGSKQNKTAPKRAPAKTTVLSSDNSDSEADDEPSNGKVAARGASAREDSIGDSESEPAAERSHDRISTASASSDDEEMDTSLTSRRASAIHNSTAAAASKQTSAVDDGPPPIPQKLLTRLLYEGFEHKDMKIGREAMNVYGKYIETFVREALARAIYERNDADKEGGGVSDGFVQVEDLERITPQLVLDF